MMMIMSMKRFFVLLLFVQAFAVFIKPSEAWWYFDDNYGIVDQRAHGDYLYVDDGEERFVVNNDGNNKHVYVDDGEERFVDQPAHGDLLHVDDDEEPFVVHGP
ncbi:unnamed protein product [Trichobilharzia szidati]|nr:unnamed protein product [Trichobilharzia szidati]